MTSRRAALLPALSLLLTALCLPPFNLWPLALVQWVPLLWFSARVDAATAAIVGCLVGAACAAHVFFGATVLDPLTLTVCCVALAGAFGAFFMAASRLLSHSRLIAPVLLAALWVSIEWLLGFALLPFSMAVTLTPAPITLQAAALGGQPLVVFLLVATQSTAVAFILHPNHLSRLRVALATVVAAVVLTIAGNVHQFAAPASLSVAAVQTDLHPYHYTFSEADGHLAFLSAHRSALEQTLMQDPPDLSVWPEVVFARFEWRAPPSITHSAPGAALFAGNDLDAAGNKYNAVFGVDRRGSVVSRHVKNTLLPRMEALYQPAQPATPHHALPGAPGSLICFESAFAGTAIALTRGGAQLLAIATSDTYAGPAILSRLHAAFTVVRAVETRRTVVRAANAGPSMIVLPDGKIVAELGLFETGVLRHDVPLSREQSVYVRSYIWWSIAFGCLALGALFLTLRVPPDEDVIALRAHLGRSALAIVLVTAALIAAQAQSVAREYADARHQRFAWPGLGFHTQIVDGPDYAGIQSLREEQDLPAVVAAALRRFGLDVATADVSVRLEELRRKSILKITARDLFTSYGLATVPFPGATSESVLPCAAALTDGSTVLITQRSGNAAKVFEPANGQYTSVPWAWLDSSLESPPVCVSGRAFAWDLR